MARRLVCSFAACAGIATAVHAGSTLADAQEATADTTAAKNADQSASSFGLEEVMVTARRREENLQTVPISITALSEHVLREKNIQTFVDLQQSVPSMTATSPYRDGFQVAIRGHGGYSPGSGPAVITYFNEVPLPPGRGDGTAGGGPGTFYDLENVQVLKGPQGTLFGRNTTGGAILFQSKRPTNEFGGYVEAAGGSYDDRAFQAVLNAPLISDKLLVRFAMNRHTRDGFTRVLATPRHPAGTYIDDMDVLAGRATITFKPTDRVQSDLIYDDIDSDANSPSNILGYVDPSGLAAQLYPDILQTLQEQLRLGVRTQVPIGSDQRSHKRTTSVTDILRIELSDDLTLRNILSYGKQELTQIIDADGSRFPVFALVGFPGPYRAEYYSEELQLQGKSLGGNLSWTAGGFFLDSPRQADYRVQAYETLGSRSLTVGRESEKSRAAYAQGTYDLGSWVDGMKLTAGLRYTQDHRFSQSRSLNVAGACVAPPPTADATCTTVRSGDFSAPTWNLTVDYQLAPHAFTYLTTRRGYRTGGFNTGALLRENQSFDPEYVTDEELGIKSEWTIGGVPARTNLALYHQDYTSVQLSKGVVLEGNRLQSVVANAGDARLWGAEFEGWIQPTEHLELGAQFAWLDFEYTDFAPGVDIAATNAAASDNRPPYKAGLNGRYHLPLDPRWGDLAIAASWSWQDDSGDASLPLDVIEAYDLLTLSLNWNRIGGSRTDASFVMTNATDNVYAVGGYALKALGYSTVTYGEPRMFAMSLRYRFGDAD